MTGVLLDTNVISELTRQAPTPSVVAFLSGLESGYVSVVTVHELAFGLERLAEGVRRQRLAETVERFLALYAGHVLPVMQKEAKVAAALRAERMRRGRTLHLADSLIAGTALVHGLTLATRNVSDFEGLGVALFDPWMET